MTVVRRTRCLFGLVVICFAAPPSQTGAQSPASGPTVVLENDRVLIERVRLAPGGRGNRQSIPQDSLAIALDAGTLEVSSAGEPATRGRMEPATTWWWPAAPASHSITSLGQQPFAFLHVRLKERHETTAASTEGPSRPAVVPGITTLLDNRRVFVEKLTLQAGFRTDPPGQSHAEYVPRDVIIVALTAGDYEVSSTGEPAERSRVQPGKVWWWPRPPATHSIANVGTARYDIVKISLK